MNTKSKLKNYGLRIAEGLVVPVIIALPFVLTFLSTVILTAGFKMRWTTALSVSFFAFGILVVVFSQFINRLNEKIKEGLKSFI